MRSVRLTPGLADGRGPERRLRRAIAGALFSIVFLALGTSAATAADEHACRDVAGASLVVADAACDGSDAVRDVVAPAASAVTGATTAPVDAATDPGPVAATQTGATQAGQAAADVSDSPATTPSSTRDAPATAPDDGTAKSPAPDTQGGQGTSKHPTAPGKAGDDQAGINDKGGLKNDSGDRGATRDPSPRNGGDRPTGNSPSGPTDSDNGTADGSSKADGSGKTVGSGDADGSSGNASHRPTQPGTDSPGADTTGKTNPSPAAGSAGSGNSGSSQNSGTESNGGGGVVTGDVPIVSGTGLDDVLTGVTGANSGKGNGNTTGKGAGADDKSDPVTGTDAVRSGPGAAPADEAVPSAGARAPIATAPRAADPAMPVATAPSWATVPPHAATHVRRTARGSHPLVTVPAASPVTVADQTLVGMRTASPSAAAGGRARFAHGPTPFDALRPDRWLRERGAAVPSPEPAQTASDFFRAAATPSGADADSRRHAGSRPTAAHVPHGGGGLPEPTPFGPPGRGAVGGASGAPGATAGSAVTCAILVGILLLTCPPLRRFRLLPVAAAPAGFPLLQQRPG